MKPTAIRSTMVPFGKDHFLLMILKLNFMRLTQMEYQNGELIFNDPQ